MKVGKRMGFEGATSPKKFRVLNSLLFLEAGGRWHRQKLLPEVEKLGFRLQVPKPLNTILKE